MTAEDTQDSVRYIGSRDVERDEYEVFVDRRGMQPYKIGPPQRPLRPFAYGHKLGLQRLRPVAVRPRAARRLLRQGRARRRRRPHGARALHALQGAGGVLLFHGRRLGADRGAGPRGAQEDRRGEQVLTWRSRPTPRTGTAPTATTPTACTARATEVAMKLPKAKGMCAVMKLPRPRGCAPCARSDPPSTSGTGSSGGARTTTCASAAGAPRGTRRGRPASGSGGRGLGGTGMEIRIWDDPVLSVVCEEFGETEFAPSSPRGRTNLSPRWSSTKASGWRRRRSARLSGRSP